MRERLAGQKTLHPADDHPQVNDAQQERDTVTSPGVAPDSRADSGRAASNSPPTLRATTGSSEPVAETLESAGMYGYLNQHRLSEPSQAQSRSKRIARLANKGAGSQAAKRH